VIYLVVEGLIGGGEVSLDFLFWRGILSLFKVLYGNRFDFDA
jgi:hypothetical protein